MHPTFSGRSGPYSDHIPKRFGLILVPSWPRAVAVFKTKFSDHPSTAVRDTFSFAAEDLAKLLLGLPPAKQQEIFNNGKDFINMELIYSQNPNVINYDT